MASNKSGVVGVSFGRIVIRARSAYNIVLAVRSHSFDLRKYGPDRIRNFAICAHVDHGKSTLADRFLQKTNVIPEESQNQFLDKLEVERTRGITVKAQTCSMFYNGHMLNFVDTPGHVDFSFEVKRSLFAVSGILLLVAANKGVQAQTLANFWMALESGLEIIPVINKIDMSNADLNKVEDQLATHFGFEKNDILRISAKTGQNIPCVFDAILERIPYPVVLESGSFRAHIFDSWFDSRKGVIALIIVKRGILCTGEKIRFFHTKRDLVPTEIGILHPEIVPCNALYAGQIGYIQCSAKSAGEVFVGDTVYDPLEDCLTPFLEIPSMRPNVYAGLFPMDCANYHSLRNSVEKLCLNDSSVSVVPEKSAILGKGWKIGFLGSLHMEVFGQRLKQEHQEDVIFTNPSVEYRAEIVDNENVKKKRYNGLGEIKITRPDTFPELISDVKRFMEPMALVSIICPTEYLSAVDNLCDNLRGEKCDVTTFDTTQTLTNWRMPLSEIYARFFDEVKSLTSGLASVDHREDGYRDCSLTKISVYINGSIVTEFSQICSTELAKSRASKLVNKIKNEIPRQQFDITIKAVVGQSTKPTAQVKIKAYKKDFSGLMKGNMVQDRLRKKLKHQEEGKANLQKLGSVRVTKEAFINVFKK